VTYNRSFRYGPHFSKSIRPWRPLHMVRMRKQVDGLDCIDAVAGTQSFEVARQRRQVARQITRAGRMSMRCQRVRGAAWRVGDDESDRSLVRRRRTA
jgi:hypothetical protein